MSVRLRRTSTLISVALEEHFAGKRSRARNPEAAQPEQIELPLVARRIVEAHTLIFKQGDPAKSYYVVASGKLVARRQHRPNLKSVSKVISTGELFIYNCDGSHAADCYAPFESIVWAIDRRWLNSAAQRHLGLTAVLHSIHAAELTMILESYRAPLIN